MTASNSNGWKGTVITILLAVIIVFLGVIGNAYRKDVDKNCTRIEAMETKNALLRERLAGIEAKMTMVQNTLEKMDKKLDDLK